MIAQWSRTRWTLCEIFDHSYSAERIYIQKKNNNNKIDCRIILVNVYDFPITLYNIQERDRGHLWLYFCLANEHNRVGRTRTIILLLLIISRRPVCWVFFFFRNLTLSVIKLKRFHAENNIVCVRYVLLKKKKKL